MMISTLFITILTSIVSLEVYTSHLHDIIGYDLHYTTGFSTKSSISLPVAAGGTLPGARLSRGHACGPADWLGGSLEGKCLAQKLGPDL